MDDRRGVVQNPSAEKFLKKAASTQLPLLKAELQGIEANIPHRRNFFTQLESQWKVRKHNNQSSPSRAAHYL